MLAPILLSFATVIYTRENKSFWIGKKYLVWDTVRKFPASFIKCTPNFRMVNIIFRLEFRNDKQGIHEEFAGEEKSHPYTGPHFFLLSCHCCLSCSSLLPLLPPPPTSFLATASSSCYHCFSPLVTAASSFVPPVFASPPSRNCFLQLFHQCLWGHLAVHKMAAKISQFKIMFCYKFFLNIYYIP